MVGKSLSQFCTVTTSKGARESVAGESSSPSLQGRGSEDLNWEAQETGWVLKILVNGKKESGDVRLSYGTPGTSIRSFINILSNADRGEKKRIAN